MFNKVKRAVLVGAPLAAMTMASAFAAEGDGALEIINTQIASLRSDAVVVIGGALGVSALFFGAKFIWTKFKGMAK